MQIAPCAMDCQGQRGRSPRPLPTLMVFAVNVPLSVYIEAILITVPSL